MSFSVYEASAPVFVRMLGNLSRILSKAEAQAEAKKIDPAALLNARLFPDMMPLVRQVQIATDTAKAGVARLASVPFPVFPDTETSFADIQGRIGATIEFIKTVPAAEIEAGTDRVITVKIRGEEINFAGYPFLLKFSLPNFYFHVTAAYMILRHNGIEIGKSDYLGPLA